MLILSKNDPSGWFRFGTYHSTRSRGSLKIGRVTMQRKGGTPDPTSLRFKINPLALFEDSNG